MLRSDQYRKLARHIVTREQFYRTIRADEVFPEMPRIMEALMVCNEMFYQAQAAEMHAYLGTNDE